MAKQKGYRQVITIATHIASQKLSEKLGFEPVGKLEYRIVIKKIMQWVKVWYVFFEKS